LAWSVDEEALQEHFGNTTPSSVHLLRMYNGRSKGCAVVEFASTEQAQQAITDFHDSVLQGRRMFCRVDREQANSTTAAAAAGGTTGSATGNTTTKLFVGNLPYDASWQSVKDWMRDSNISHILRVDGGRGHALVTVPADQASNIIATLNGQDYEGRAVTVRMDHRGGSAGGAGAPPGTAWHVTVPAGTSWQTLKDHLRATGAVVEKVVVQGTTATVTFASPQDATTAQSCGPLDGSGLEFTQSTSAPTASGTRLFVQGLDDHTSWQDLKDHVRTVCACSVSRVQTLRGGRATVEFATAADAQTALPLLQDSELDGGILQVKVDSKV